jgi:hypothetical protein
MYTRRQTFWKAGALLASALARAQDEPRSVRVPFQHAAGRGSILIQARVNGKPAVLIVDTGSSHTILRPALLRIATSELARPRTGGGVVGDAIGREVALEVGEHVWPRRRVSVMDLTQVLAAYTERIDGLLGLDFFLDHSQAIINFKDRAITFIR